MAPDQSQEPLTTEELDYPPDADETHNSGADLHAGGAKVPDDSDHQPQPTLRLRVAPWDMACTIVLIAMLLYLATATPWPLRLFGFLKDVCVGETCGPVPFGVDIVHLSPWPGAVSVRRSPRPESGRSCPS